MIFVSLRRSVFFVLFKFCFLFVCLNIIFNLLFSWNRLTLIIKQVPYRKLTVEYLNLIFGNSDEHRTWWQSTLPPLLSLYFNISSNPSLLNATDLRQAIFLSSEKNIRRDSLFRRVTQLTALRFSEESTQKISMGCGATHDPVVMLDLIEIGDRVKPMDIVSLYQGNFYLFKSLAAGGVSAEIGMLSQVGFLFVFLFVFVFVLFIYFLEFWRFEI